MSSFYSWLISKWIQKIKIFLGIQRMKKLQLPGDGAEFTGETESQGDPEIVLE